MTETLLQLCTVVGQLVTQLSGSSPAETLAEASDALAEEIDEELGAGAPVTPLSSGATGSGLDRSRFRNPCSGCGAEYPDHKGSECPGRNAREEKEKEDREEAARARELLLAVARGSQISSAGVTGVTVLPGPSPVTSNVHVTGARFYAVLVARGGQQPGIYRTYRRYAEAVAVPGSSPPGGGRQGPRANHLDFAPGTASHSFPTLGQARAWLEREGWVARYGVPVVEHW